MTNTSKPDHESAYEGQRPGYDAWMRDGIRQGSEFDEPIKPAVGKAAVEGAIDREHAERDETLLATGVAKSVLPEVQAQIDAANRSGLNANRAALGKEPLPPIQPTEPVQLPLPLE